MEPSNAPGEFQSQTGVEALVRQLTEGNARGRASAAVELRSYGAAAVEPLCRALEDRNPAVRVYVAESLGAIGDHRAVAPLLGALHNWPLIRSPRRFQWTTSWLIIAGGVFALLTPLLPAYLRPWSEWAMVACAIPVMGGLIYFGNSWRSRLCYAIVVALERIAEREPTGELASSIPDLRATLYLCPQGKETRAAEHAVSRIQALTDGQRSLPLPALRDERSDEALPRASSPPGA